MTGGLKRVEEVEASLTLVSVVKQNTVMISDIQNVLQNIITLLFQDDKLDLKPFANIEAHCVYDEVSFQNLMLEIMFENLKKLREALE
ncbi:MAG: hypothetical protein GX222_04435 [Ruminococcaceae bacterium]|nr:hypothetical protein [Oscillospiraceae bacterium]